MSNSNNACAGDKNKSAVPQQEPCMPPEQDPYLPISNVTRIMRRILPSDAKISFEARVYTQYCATEYIRFVTDEANHICQSHRRTKITAGNIISAMTTLKFEDYVGPLDVFINRYRLSETNHGFSLRGESSSFDPAYGGSDIRFHDPPHNDAPPHGTAPDGRLTHDPPPHGSSPSEFHGPPSHGPTSHASLPHGSQPHGPSPPEFHGPPSHGPTPHGSLPYSPPTSGHYGYDMLDQSMVMGGGDCYYPNGSGQDGTTGGGGSSSSMNEMPFNDQYGQKK